VNPALHTQLPLTHVPFPLHGMLPCAMSDASATSLNARPLGHVRMEQSPPVNPLLQEQIPSGVQVPFREHLFGHPKQGSVNEDKIVTVGMNEMALMDVMMSRIVGLNNRRCENLGRPIF
jgi:hypothetical protein